MFNVLMGDKFSNMLSSPVFWYTVIGLIGLIVIIVACFKFPAVGKWVVFSVLGVVFIVLTTYSGVQLERYYSAEGGIYGRLTGMFVVNEVEQLDSKKISLTNIELLQEDKDKNLYSASIQMSDVYKLENNSEYLILVNSVPCTSSDNASDYVKAEYTYTFYDKNREEILTDTLVITFAFYSNSTRLTLETYGGLEAVGLWNYYFNKNTFIIDLVEKQFSSSDLEFVVGDTSNMPKCEINISSDIDFALRVKGEEIFVSGSSNLQDSIDSSILLAIEDSFGILYVDPDYSILVNTDGVYSISYDETTMYRIISYSNATYLNVEIVSNL